MPVICWAPLAKSAQDPTTIAEYISSRILNHDLSPSAHGLDGYAVYNHRVADILDHADGSVFLEKLTATKRLILSAFESMDGWSTLGTISQDLGNVRISTTAILNNLAIIYAVPTDWLGIDWDKSFFWQSTVKLSAIVAQQVYFGVGGSDDLGGFSGAGFYVADGTLYCYHAEDSGAGYVYTTFEITGITLTDWNVYRIIYDQVAGELKFYVNGVLKKTFDSGLPTSDTDELSLYQIKTTATVIKRIMVSDLLFSADR